MDANFQDLLVKPDVHTGGLQPSRTRKPDKETLGHAPCPTCRTFDPPRLVGWTSTGHRSLTRTGDRREPRDRRARRCRGVLSRSERLTAADAGGYVHVSG